MGTGSRLLRNTTYLTIANQIGNLLQFLFFLFFARHFGQEIVGQYSFAFSFTYVLTVLADLGLAPYLIREVAKDPSHGRQLFLKCLTLRLLAIFVSSLLGLIIIFLFLDKFSTDIIKIILLLGLFHIFFSLADVFLAEFKGHDKMGLVALLNLFLRLVISSAAILLILLRFDFLAVLACFPLGSFIYLLTCIYLSFHYFDNIQLHFKRLNLQRLLINVLPFTFTIIFAEALYHQDILILRFLTDDQTVGIFSAANKIVLAFLGILVFVHTALLPTFSRLHVDSHTGLIAISKQCIRYLLLMGLPIAVGLFAISDKLVVLFYSHSFRDSATALKILSWTIALGFSAATFSVLLTAINRQSQKVVVIGICLAFNFMLNLLLIPQLGYNGAAAAKLLTEGLHLLLMAYLVAKYLTRMPFVKTVIKPATSCLVMYIFIQLTYEYSLLYIIPASAFVYLLSLGISGAYDSTEIQFMKQFCLNVSRTVLNSKLFRTCVSRRL